MLIVVIVGVTRGLERIDGWEETHRGLIINLQCLLWWMRLWFTLVLQSGSRIFLCLRFNWCLRESLWEESLLTISFEGVEFLVHNLILSGDDLEESVLLNLYFRRILALWVVRDVGLVVSIVKENLSIVFLEGFLGVEILQNL